MPIESSIVLRSRPVGIFVVALGILAAAYGMPLFFATQEGGLPADNVAKVRMVCLGVFALLLLVGLYERSRTLVLGDGRIEIGTLLSRRSFQVVALRGVTFRRAQHIDTPHSESFLVFFGSADEELGEMKVSYVADHDVRTLLERLQNEQPALEIERPVRRYLAS